METPDIIYIAPFHGKKGNYQDYVGMAWDKPDDSCEHVAYVRRDLIEGMIRDLKERVEQEPAEWSEDYREEDLRTRFAFYTYKDDDSVLYLSNVFVEETSRNHGFGTRILAAAEKVAETIGATTICLKVKQDSPANAWYRKNGYGYVAFEDGYDWLEKNLKYLKPKKSIKWSGDDELMIESLIAYLKGTGQDFISNDMVYWLKSLPERFNLPPKQEWSEEDESMRWNIIQDLREFRDCETDEELISDYEDEIAWLKSLRSRPKSSDNRKPSEEQQKREIMEGAVEGEWIWATTPPEKPGKYKVQLRYDTYSAIWNGVKWIDDASGFPIMGVFKWKPIKEEQQ